MRGDGDIRQAVEADAEALAVVHCAAALLAYRHIFPPDAAKPSPASLLAGWQALCRSSGDDAVFVAERDGRPVGVAALVVDRRVPAGLLLSRLYVDPTCWGNGIGARLHDRVLATAADQGALSIDLWVLEHNHRARVMYERWGWQHRPGPQLDTGVPRIVDVLYERDLTVPLTR